MIRTLVFYSSIFEPKLVLSSITKKGEIESASRPLNDFGVFWQSQFRDIMLSIKCVQEQNDKFKKKMKERSPISFHVWWNLSEF